MRDVERGAGGLASLALAASRHKLLFVTVFASIAAASAAFILTLTPRYTADAMLLLPAGQEQDLTGGSQKSGPVDPFAVRSETDILSNDALALKVIEQLDLLNNAELAHVDKSGLSYAIKSAIDDVLSKARLGAVGETKQSQPRFWSEKDLALSRVLTAYKKRLSIYNDGRSSTVNVSFWAEDPRLAQTIANAHVQAYLASQAQRRVESQKAATGWLAKEIEARAADVKSADAASQALRAKYGLVLTQQDNQRRSTVDQELAQLNEQLTAARLAVASSQSKLGQFEENASQSANAATTETISAPVMLRLREREADARLALSRLENSFQAASPGLNAAKAEVDKVAQLIKDEILLTKGTLLANLDADKRRVAILEGEMSAAKARKLALDQAQIELTSLETLAQSKRAIYESLLNRFNVLLAQTGFTAADAKVIAPAIVPTTPSFPKTSLYMLMALAGALGAAMCAAYAVESMAFSKDGPALRGGSPERAEERANGSAFAEARHRVPGELRHADGRRA